MDNRGKMMLNELSSNDLFHNSSYDTDKELLILYVEISENNTQILTVHETDNIEQLVHDFCNKQNIGPNAEAYLLEEVEKSIVYYYPPVNSHIPDSIDQELTNDDIKFEELNKGVELYAKGQKLRERAEKKREKIRNERSLKESENATFKPRVNSPERRPKPPEQYLTEKGKKTVESLNKKRTELETKIMEECSFSPAINKNSGNMQKSLMRSPDRFSSLYKDAKTIQDKLQKKSEEL
jgi:hypothetical protein